MNRRHFATSLATGLAGLAAAERGDAAGDSRRNAVYLLESFRLQQGTQRGRLDEFFTSALLPALDKMKTQPLVMEAVIGPHTPEVLSVVGFSSMAEMGEMRAKLGADPAVAKALAKMETGPEPPYDSQQITLLEAAPYSPASLPQAAGEKKAPRYFELRVYHNSSRTILRALHERFAGPETRIFARSGIHPVLYGTTVIGGDVPNLTYLIPFDSLGAREKAWDTFNADPEWVKVRAESNKNGQLVSVANVSIYKAAAYSPVQ
jgi:NIPSNAP